ncbi:MAG TPA: hypothetical protein PKD90_20060, partial [Phnomibacter sp.]|nr:hypothetical protein [Phnomibacter sp.]
MKRILIAFAAFLLTGASTFGQALIQGGLLPPTPGQANAVTFALKPLSHYNETFSSVGFTIQIPVSVGPKPSIINLESYLPTVFPLAAWGIEEITHEGFYNYLLYCVTNNPPSTVIPANTEQPILKIAFDVNPFTAATTRVRVAHLAGAGPETKYQFFVTSNGLDNLNYKQMFFGAVRAPTIPYDDDQVGWDNYQYAETTFDVALPVK